MHRALPLLALVALLTGCTAGPEPSPTPTADDTLLADLTSDCVSGDYLACDVLYLAASGNAELRALADSCGGQDHGTGWCVERYDVTIDPAALHDDCAAGEMLACDALYAYSPVGSEDERFGWSCGERGRISASCVLDHGASAA